MSKGETSDFASDDNGSTLFSASNINGKMNASSKKIITIDGAQGEGGGQILRTSLSLATCLGQNICIKRIRAGRSKPGLMRQHLTCVQASQQLCKADVQGAEMGSTELLFQPNDINVPNELTFDIGTAGSTSLVFQTVLPIVLFSKAKCMIHFVGGTHNMAAPTYDFLAESFIHTLNRFGMDIQSELHQPGFYPVGGGHWSVKIKAAEFKRIDLTHRGELQSRKAVARLGNLSRDIGERELEVIRQKSKWDEDDLFIDSSHCIGNGNALILQLNFENIQTVFDQIGQRNRSAEKVALATCSVMARYLNNNVAVEKYLADQLLLPMVLGKGGQFTTTKPSEHLLTNISIIQQIAGVEITVEQHGNTNWLVTVQSPVLANNKKAAELGCVKTVS